MPATAQPHAKVQLLIRSVRQQRVILDSDLAALYGVPTIRFNQAFKRNRDRFPPDFAFQLSAAEFAGLKSQIVTSNLQAVERSGLAPNSSQSVISSRKLLPLLAPPPDPPKPQIGFYPGNR